MHTKTLIDAARHLTGAIDAGAERLERPVREHYLGMSSLGHCARELWHHCHTTDIAGKNVDPQLQRIFDLGNSIEALVIGYMKASGEVDIESTQAEYRDLDDRLRGHSDVVYTFDGRRVVGDVKSMNTNNFDRFSQVGFKRSHWQYYVQLQMYAGYEKADFISLLAYNKDNSATAAQAYPFDEGVFDAYRARAQMILAAKSPPPCEKGNGRVKWCKCAKRDGGGK